MARHSRRGALPRLFAAFTLMELTVTLAVIALLASMATLSLREPWRNAILADTARQLVAFDEFARQAARQSDAPLTLTINPSTQSVSLGEILRTIHVNSPIKSAMVDGSSTQESISLTISPCGRSPNYAICLDGEDGTSRWIVFLGLTGYVVHTDQQDDVIEICAAD